MSLYRPAVVNAKRKGSRNEHRSMRLLEKQGFACTRAAASLGVWDIIAIGPDGNKLVQVKTNRWPLTAEMNAMKAFACHPINEKEVWRWDDFARAPKVKKL